MTDEQTATQALTERERAAERLEEAEADHPSSTRLLAEKWLRDGTVDETTSIAAAKELLEQHYRPAAQQ